MTRRRNRLPFRPAGEHGGSRHPEDEAADVCPPRDRGVRLEFRRRHLLEKPERQDDERGDPEDEPQPRRPDYREPQEANLREGVPDQERAHHARDRARGADEGQGCGPRREPVREERREAARRVQEHEEPGADDGLDERTDRPEEEHVPREMHEARVREQRPERAHDGRARGHEAVPLGGAVRESLVEPARAPVQLLALQVVEPRHRGPALGGRGFHLLREVPELLGTEEPRQRLGRRQVRVLGPVLLDFLSSRLDLALPRGGAGREVEDDVPDHVQRDERDRGDGFRTRAVFLGSDRYQKHVWVSGVEAEVAVDDARARVLRRARGEPRHRPGGARERVDRVPREPACPVAVERGAEARARHDPLDAAHHVELRSDHGGVVAERDHLRDEAMARPMLLARADSNVVISARRS